MQHYIKQHPTNASEPQRLKMLEPGFQMTPIKFIKCGIMLLHMQLNVAYNTFMSHASVSIVFR